MSSSVCNSADLLHPQLMDTAYIIDYLKHRQLAIPNIELKSRDELLKIFHSYAMPLHKRTCTRHRNVDHQMDTLELTPSADQPAFKSGSKHKRIIYESNTTLNMDNNSKSVDLVTNGCKRIKIGAICVGDGNGISENKRGLQETKVECSFSQMPKRQKITWP